MKEVKADLESTFLYENRQYFLVCCQDGSGIWQLYLKEDFLNDKNWITELVTEQKV